MKQISFWLTAAVVLSLAIPETNVVAEQSAQPPAPTPESESSDPQTESDAELLTVIASPGFGEYNTTLRRFEFLVDEFSEHCPIKEGGASPRDMLINAYRSLKKAGLDGEESLLDLANTLHRMTAELTSRVTASGFDLPGCAKIWAGYLTLRLQGKPPTEAREDVTGMVRALLRPH